ncbi:MAG: helix-turn-helix domain-containing protein [Oscillospiraceae bacterium]|nr:helix-turn-helix domain-containing protein [Oscillospiraceae bacterium]
MRERLQIFDPRQTMQRDTFEVFHYREPRPNSVEVHHHDFYEVYYLIKGEVEYWVDGRIIRMQTGDLLLINPMELHRPVVHPDSPVYERIVLWINKEYLENLHSGQMDLSRCFDTRLPAHTHLIQPSVAERSALTARMGELVREYYSRELGSDLCAYGLFLQFMVQLNRMAQQEKAQPEQARQLSALVEKVLGYIGENLSEPMTLEKIAEQFFVSKYYLSHTFSREVGVSVYRYILLRRLLLARQLLATGEPAGQVCRSCGFSDYTSFYRAFKSEYGISPREFVAGTVSG